MARRRQTPEQIISNLREVEVGLATGRLVEQVCKALGATEQTCQRWEELEAFVRQRIQGFIQELLEEKVSALPESRALRREDNSARAACTTDLTGTIVS